MARPYTQLYCHLVWATWDRLPLIAPTVEHRLYEVLKAEFRKMQCVPIAVGGLEDHLHCLIFVSGDQKYRGDCEASEGCKFASRDARRNGTGWVQVARVVFGLHASAEYP